MQKVLALAAALTLVLTGDAFASFHPEGLIVPARTQLRPAPTGVPTQSLKLARVMVELPEGGPWARMREGWPPMLREPLVANAGRVEIDTSTFDKAFAEEMKAAGYKSDFNLGLFNNDFNGDLQAGFVIQDLKGDFCNGCGFFTPNSDASGAVLMSGQWQLYSARDRKIIATVATSGGVERKESKPGGPMTMLVEAFSDNVRQLIASDEFRRAVLEVPAGGVAPTADASTLKIDLVAGTNPKTVGEAIGSVVAIFSSAGMGSGFLVSTDGYLITNHHVVGDAKYVKIRWSDGYETVGEVVRSHKARDVALIKTDPHGRRPLALRPVEPPPGETVFAIGTPLDEALQNTLTKGVVSANRVVDGKSYIQSDVAVDHGNSGGPLVDEKGQVVGITQWGYAPDGVSHNLNFFIPIGDALDFLALKPQS